MSESDSEPEDSQAGQGETSGSSGSSGGPGISDDELPEDLQPTDDNPLAKSLSDDDEDEGFSPDTGGGV